jgi:hypothetical protein
VGITDDAKRYEVVRCPHCESAELVRPGQDDTEPHRNATSARLAAVASMT